MKNYSILSVTCLIFASLLLVLGCKDDTSGQQNAAGQQLAMSLPVVEIPTKTLTAYVTYPASIEGVVNSEVRAKVAGYITDVLVDEGQKVNRGETLFKLETQSLNQDAAAAAANVNAAEVEVEKLKPLVDKNIISEVQLETAKAQLQQAKSSYNSIVANIDYANIKSPVDGYVGDVRLRKGTLVSPTNQTPLTMVSDISQVYAYFSMNEKDYLNFIQNAEGATISQKIEKMPKVNLLLPNDSLFEEQGTIETINSQVDPNTGSISFRAKFDNPSRLLTNGNSGKIQVPKTFEDAVVVPKESTFERQGTTYVYKLDRENMATAASIVITQEIDNLYVVASGLKKGDRIVAKGVSQLRGATEIQPQEIPFDSIAQPIQKVFR
ncbi:efflux RND transporter periplasmic adaptor subunit [Pareuzebyella sediminis]|uniref:efflux RND transporter periplasmic adaptor subunit n=1 Tax=Pareuzebyella sediminis TaxID=2607998 RepID=UPI0011EBF021|nr:efflux RND transporter periplasmic adaptor subunit [Pareuzebyella sediminis]